ncbi:MAG: O-antigen ligase family protein [Patescibacteria group bacterium]
MPRILLILLPLLLPTYVVRFHIGPLPTTLLEVSLLVMLCAWTKSRGINGWKNSIANIRSRGWLLPLGLWLAAGTIAIFVAPNHIAALGLWRAYFLEPILIFVMLSDLIRGEKEKRTLINSLAITVTLLGLWAVGQYLGLLPISAPWDAPPQGFRAIGPFPFPNALALFCAPAAALFFALAINRKGEKIGEGGRTPPLREWIGFAAGTMATLLAKSDGGLIAIAAAVMVTLFLKKKTRRIAVAIALISLVATFAIPQLGQKVGDQILFREWSGKVRLVMWDETVAMLRSRPIFGAGLGAFPVMIAPYHVATWMEVFQYPHNILLNLWSETGLLGLIAFGLILFTWWRRGRTLALPMIAAILVHGIVDVPYFKNDLAVLFWILIIISLDE